MLKFWCRKVVYVGPFGDRMKTFSFCFQKGATGTWERKKEFSLFYVEKVYVGGTMKQKVKHKLQLKMVVHRYTSKERRNLETIGL